MEIPNIRERIMSASLREVYEAFFLDAMLIVTGRLPRNAALPKGPFRPRMDVALYLKDPVRDLRRDGSGRLIVSLRTPLIVNGILRIDPAHGCTFDGARTGDDLGTADRLSVIARGHGGINLLRELRTH